MTTVGILTPSPSSKWIRQMQIYERGYNTNVKSEDQAGWLEFPWSVKRRGWGPWCREGRLHPHLINTRGDIHKWNVNYIFLLTIIHQISVCELTQLNLCVSRCISNARTLVWMLTPPHLLSIKIDKMLKSAQEWQLHVNTYLI